MSVVEFKKTDAYGEVTEYEGVFKRVCTLYEVIDDILKKCCSGYLNIIGECTYEMKGSKINEQIPQSLLKRKVSGIYIKSDWLSNVRVYLYKEDEGKLDAIEEYKENLRRDMMKVLMKYEKKIGMPIHSVTVDKQEDFSLSSTYRGGVFGFEIVV